MKIRFLILLSALLCLTNLSAQTPTSFQYQAVLRDASGGILANKDVEIGIAILQGSITGNEVFSETHLVTTNSFGLANLQIGSVNTTGMEAMGWGSGPYFVQVSLDGTIMGTSQLLSVPYALYAKSVENDLVDDADADPVNELQDLSLTGTELSISEGSTVDLSILQDGIGTDSQKLRFTNNKYLEITNGNTVRLPFLYKEDDGDPENELQTLSKSGLEISLDQNGGTVRDSILTETQVDAMVANNGYQLSANDMDTDPSNEIQVLSISNDTIYLVNGGFVKLPAETDPIFSAWDRSTGVAISESQITDLKHFTNADETDPVYSADSSFIKYGVRSWNSSLAKQINASDTTRWGSDTDKTNELNTSVVLNGTDLEVTDAGGTITTDLSSLINDADADPTNELQILSISNDTIYLSDGGKIKLPAETDPTFVADSSSIKTSIRTNEQAIAAINSEADGTAPGQMQYWNGTAWITVAAGNEGQVLTFSAGVPTWKTQLEDGDVKNPTTGKIWMDRNLGASQVATSSRDTKAYGDLYQWGRAADGHESRTSGTTSTLSTTDTPGHGNFITNGTFPYDWRSPRNDNLWQGVSGTNNPCPSGYRLPTEAEWEAERTSWSSDNSVGAFASPLKLPMAGESDYRDGSLRNVGSSGCYWSSTVYRTTSRHLYFGSNAFWLNYLRASGLSVRCLKD